jgi:hypothetical protein
MNKIHCKYIGDSYWKVFITEDGWDTFSFIMSSKTEPTRKDIEKVWNSPKKEVSRVF